jgi:hypothetical protein
MELNKIEELTEEIPAEQRRAILKLIDLKTNEDMKELIKSNEMLKESVNQSINLLKETVSKDIKHLEDKNAERSKTLYWVLGVIVAIMVALKLFGH